MRTTATLSRFPLRPPALFSLPDAATRRLVQCLAALVAGAGIWILAGLLWGFSSPRPAPFTSLEERPAALGERIAARALFASRRDAETTPTATTDNWQLLGVSASGDERTARAIVRREGQAVPLVLAIGDEVDKGIRLLRIEPERIVIRGQAGETALSLPGPRHPDLASGRLGHD